MIPAGLTEVVYHTRDEGLHLPERRNRAGAADALAPARNLALAESANRRIAARDSYPSEEVVLLPVSGQ